MSPKISPKASLIVQKYGGSSLAKPEQIRDAAARIAGLHRQGHKLIVVVSAMGKTTDQLVELAYATSPRPNRRELDMLLSTGERVSMALMSMALNDLGVPAISFTGSQAGIFTDDLHSNARIVDVKPIRVESELEQGHVVVLAGFQGVSPVTKEITTLGRGGSDTTAVALAAHFKAEYCEILKDVDGVHSADPNLVKDSRHLDRLHYSSLLDMTFWGAKVLHYRSVELAAVMNVPLRITLAHGEGRATLVDGAQMYEQARILSVNSHAHVRKLEATGATTATALENISKELSKFGLPLPQLLDCEATPERFSFLVTAPLETLEAIAARAGSAFTVAPEKLATVTATCQGAYASPLAGQLAHRLENSGIRVRKIVFGAQSLSVVIDAKDRENAIREIHDLAN